MPENRAPFLPKLKPNHQIGQFPSFGAWLERDEEVLRAVSDGIEESNLIADASEVQASIPDVWARALLFEIALYDREHPLHERTREEWRGLLAILALKEVLKIPITVEEINIPLREEECTEHYLLVLYRSLPERSISDDTSWHNIHVICYEGKPIGITSPITLVCPGIEYTNTIGSHLVSWFSGKRLQDPIRYLSPVNLAAVCQWTEAVRNELNRKGNLHPDLRKNLITALDIFVTDLSNKLQGVLRGASFSDHGLGMGTGVFALIDKPMAGSDVVDVSKSDVLLMANKEKEPEKTWLIVDKAIPQNWGVEPKEINVVNSYTLANRDLLLTDKNYFARHNVEIKSSEDIFTKKLVLVRQELPGSYSIVPTPLADNRGGFVTPLLPVIGELSDHILPQNLAKQITFEKQHNGVTVSLELQLTRGRVTLQHFYRDEADIEYLADVPVLEFWPNFVVPNWKVYYLYASYAIDPSFTFEVKPRETQCRTIRHVRHQKGSGGSFMEVYRLDSFPEVLECSKQGIGFAGLIFVKKPAPLSIKEGEKWWASVDFGTVNTNVFVRIAEETDPEEFLFKRDLIGQITGTLQQRERYLPLEFIPPEDRLAPFPSIYHNFDGANQGFEPLLDGHVFFAGKETKLDFGKKELNLKWGEKTADREHLRAFIKQLVYHVLAEAVRSGIGTVEWRFAYPSAFSEDDRGEYLRYWSSILDKEEVRGDTGVHIEMTPPLTESVATARFFEMIPTGLVAIDIGGGTTDISIWQRDSLVFQTSILFAGRDIFEKAARGKENLKLVGRMLSKAKVERDKCLELESNRKNPLEFSFIFFSLLRSNERQIFQALSNYTGRDEYKEFASYLSVGLSGLFYYVGLIVAQLLHQKSYLQDYTSVFIAGNGSKIYRWLLSPEHKLKRIFAEISGLERFKIEPTKRPKSEVAIGLLKEAQEIKYNRVSLDAYVSGECFLKAGLPCTPQDMVTTKDFTEGLVDIGELSELRKFFTLFDEVWGTQYSTRIDWNVITAKMKNRFARYHNVDKRKVRCEPIFFTGLREVMDSLVEF